jgi:hypothetical protein
MHDDAVRDELIILAVAPGERACGRSQVSGVRCQVSGKSHASPKYGFA